MNIVIIGGSQKIKDSASLLSANMLVDKIGLLYKQKISVKTYSIKNTSINLCRGCMNCFNKGLCKLDKEDDMEEVRKFMLSADYIIFASPIYVGSVSAYMKSFFDRCSSWMHTMRLIGKKSIIITSSSGNGTELVENYMRIVSSALGMRVSAILHIIATSVEDVYLEYNQDIIETAADYVVNKPDVSFNNTELNIYFNKLLKYAKYDILGEAEINYWKTTGLINCKNIDSAENLLKERA